MHSTTTHSTNLEANCKLHGIPTHMHSTTSHSTNLEANCKLHCIPASGDVKEAPQNVEEQASLGHKELLPQVCRDDGHVDREEVVVFSRGRGRCVCCNLGNRILWEEAPQQLHQLPAVPEALQVS